VTTWTYTMIIVPSYDAGHCRHQLGEHACGKAACFKITAQLGSAQPIDTWRCCNHAAAMAHRVGIPFPPVRRSHAKTA
jgi:hypothetical protein